MENDTKWQNLQALKELHNQGFITKTEYRERLKQLIDELTGTTISTPSATQISTQRIQREMSIDSAIVARPPPDFIGVERETAIKWSYDLKGGKWSKKRIRVKLDTTPFARGALRVAYHMRVCSDDETHSERTGAVPLCNIDNDDEAVAGATAAHRSRHKKEIGIAAASDIEPYDSKLAPGTRFSESDDSCATKIISCESVKSDISVPGGLRSARRMAPPECPGTSGSIRSISSAESAIGIVSSSKRGRRKDLQSQGTCAIEHSSQTDKKATYVAKISLREEDHQNREAYFRDVEMQCLAGYIAERFNRCNPPKQVEFLEAFVVELEEREGRPICGVERYIRGPYRKHNSNYGYVNEEERNTPQAFSHFSWHVSNGEVLLVDLQGVSDMYTDPQVHSVSGKGYGKGNLGMKGIRKFLENHRCNRICHYLRLPPVNRSLYPYAVPIEGNPRDTGTLPVTQVMRHNINILTYDPRNLENKPLTTGLPILPGSPNVQSTRSPRDITSMEKTKCNCAVI